MRKHLPKFNEGGRAAAGKESIAALPKMTLPTPSSLDVMRNAQTALNNQQKKEFNAGVQKFREEQISNNQQKQGNSPGLSSNASAGISMGANLVGGATDMLTANMKVDENSAFNQQQAVGDMLLKSGNPYAAIAGVALKAGSAMDQALGTNINTINKEEAKAAGISGAGRVLNNVLGFLPTGGMGALVGKTDSVRMNEETKQMSGAFGGSVQDISTAEGMSNGRYLIGKGKINNLIKEAQRQNQIISDISTTNTMRKMSDYGSDIAQQNMNRFAGNNYQNVHVGKNGMKLASVEEIRRILELQKETNIQSFHNGGVIGVDVNVIAEGKYHAHKNNLENVSEELSDLTKKGIPVIAHGEGGEIEQVAEIEKKELIFRLEVTKKLEELYKDGSDEAMIEAGKLVAMEIIENTQDNSGEVLTDE